MTPRPLTIGDRVRILYAVCGYLPLARIGTTAHVVKVTYNGGVWLAAKGLKKPCWIPADIAGACLERVR